MSITSVLLGAFGGVAASVVAKKLVDLWNTKKGDLKDWAINLDNRLEQRWGNVIPDDVNAAYDAIISQTVAYVDRYATSRDFWKLVIQNILSLTPAKFDLYMAQLQNLDLAAKLKDQVSEELLKIINQTKQQVAIDIVKNKAVVASLPPAADIAAKIDAAAVANKINEPIQPVTTEVLERLARESRARQEALKNHGA